MIFKSAGIQIQFTIDQVKMTHIITDWMTEVYDDSDLSFSIICQFLPNSWQNPASIDIPMVTTHWI